MAKSYQQVMLFGNLGADPEIRALQNGSKVATLSIATSKSWKDQRGEWQEKTAWHRAIAWQNEKGPQLVKIAENLKKGDKVFAIGEIDYRSWQDREGTTRYTTEIKLSQLSFAGKPAGVGAPAAAPAKQEEFGDFPEALEGEDADLPF